MTNDDHYAPEHVLARVKTLLTYKASCVGCETVGVYDLCTGNSKYLSNGSLLGAAVGTAGLLGALYVKVRWRKIPYMKIVLDVMLHVNPHVLLIVE